MSYKKVLSASLNCRHQGILGQNIATAIFSYCWCLGGKEQKPTFAQAIKRRLFLDTPLKTQGETMKLGLIEDKNKGPITRVSLSLIAWNRFSLDLPHLSLSVNWLLYETHIASTP